LVAKLVVLLSAATNWSASCFFLPRTPKKSTLLHQYSTTEQSTDRSATKNQLLSLISSTPANAQTPAKQSKDILDKVRRLEQLCPSEDEQVVSTLAGNWELMWTTQDKSSDEWGLGPLRTWIK
jgi:hypothetical protein